MPKEVGFSLKANLLYKSFNDFLNAIKSKSMNCYSFSGPTIESSDMICFSSNNEFITIRKNTNRNSPDDKRDSKNNFIICGNTEAKKTISNLLKEQLIAFYKEKLKINLEERDIITITPIMERKAKIEKDLKDLKAIKEIRMNEKVKYRIKEKIKLLDKINTDFREIEARTKSMNIRSELETYLQLLDMFENVLFLEIYDDGTYVEKQLVNLTSAFNGFPKQKVLVRNLERFLEQLHTLEKN